MWSSALNNRGNSTLKHNAILATGTNWTARDDSEPRLLYSFNTRLGRPSIAAGPRLLPRQIRSDHDVQCTEFKEADVACLPLYTKMVLVLQT